MDQRRRSIRMVALSLNSQALLITAASGNEQAVASILITPRNAERSLELIGRAPLKEFQGAEEWITGNYAYLSTISDKLLVFDVSDPAHPKLTDTIKVDARLIMTSAPPPMAAFW